MDYYSIGKEIRSYAFLENDFDFFPLAPQQEVTSGTYFSLFNQQCAIFLIFFVVYSKLCISNIFSIN